MDHFIYTAVSGANRSLAQQQIHANNLANVNTQGFRGDMENAVSSKVAGSGYDTRYMVQERNDGVDMTPGTIQDTGRNLDVAIQGSGLIALRSGNREMYTRNGQIDVSPTGELTIGGKAVLGETGPIILPPFSSVSIGNDGTISIIPEDGDVKASMDVDRLKLVDIPANQLRKDSSGLLLGNRRTAARSEAVQVASGHLEMANVSAINEMTASISLNRQFEAQIKMMKVAEDLADTGNRLIRGS